jgi:hypothetical protein
MGVVEIASGLVPDIISTTQVCVALCTLHYVTRGHNGTKVGTPLADFTNSIINTMRDSKPFGFHLGEL